MFEFVTAMIDIFAKFVKMLFELPFYGNVTYGYLLLAIYVAAIILFFLIGRMR